MKNKYNFMMTILIIAVVGISFIIIPKYNKDADIDYKPNSKDKVISVLLKQGFDDYAGDKKMYYTTRSMLAPNGGACEGVEIVQFEDYDYEVHMVCYLNSYLAYERTEIYNWKYDTLTSTINEYNEYNGNLIRSIKASIDSTGNFSCNINNCDYYKTSLLTVKGKFLDIINEANVTTYDID